MLKKGRIQKKSTAIYDSSTYFDRNKKLSTPLGRQNGSTKNRAGRDGDQAQEEVAELPALERRKRSRETIIILRDNQAQCQTDADDQSCNLSVISSLGLRTIESNLPTNAKNRLGP